VVVKVSKIRAKKIKNPKRLYAEAINTIINFLTISNCSSSLINFIQDKTFMTASKYSTE